MNLSDKDIDQLFQQADGKASFEFKDAYWSEMQQILQKKDRRKAVAWWLNVWFLLPVSLLLSLSIMAGFSGRGNTDQEIAVEEETGIAELLKVSLNTSKLKTEDESPSEMNIKTVQNYSLERAVSGSSVQSFRNGEKGNGKIRTYNQSAGISAGNKRITNNSRVEEYHSSVIPEENDVIAQENETMEIISENPVITMDSPDSETDADSAEAVQEAVTSLTESLVSDPALKPKWNMYVGAGIGMVTNLGLSGKHYGAGVVRLEYGISKAFGRFTVSPAIAIESTFGTSVSFVNKYYEYDFIRNEKMQEYNYNRFTNVLIPVRAGYYLGKSRKSHLQLMVAPVFMLNNNLVYKESKNGVLMAKDEYFNQHLGLNGFYLNLGIGYSFMLSRNCSLGLEYNNNLGMNRDKSLSGLSQSKTDHQFIIQLRYFIK
ncbi:MAG: hypothetical protein BGO87_13880 [Flavobacteriia bacterium 40-80]|nr:MAG: hypothetical protein BGO87_13880 [Flavobacteriia bacterium 40-80]